MKHPLNSRFKLCAAMAIFGTLGLFTRFIPVSSGELALYRAVLAAALILVFLLVTRQPISFALVKKELPLLLISGIALGVNWILLFQAYRYTTISTATLSYYFAPVLVTVVSPLLFKEKLTGKQILCFVMSTLGLVLVIGTNGLKGGTDAVGILFGLGAAVFYAAVVLLNKFIRHVGGLHRTLLQFLAVIITLVPYVALTGGSTLTQVDELGWACLLIVGLVHTGVAYCLYFTSLRDLPGQKAAILSYIDPLVAVLVSVLLLNEPMTIRQLLGGILILGFTLWNEITPKTRQ